MDDQHDQARARFHESSAQFSKAHKEGLRGLLRGDLEVVDVAIADERDAIQKAARAIELARATEDAPAARGTAGASLDAASLHEEHERLRGQLRTLQAEHAALEDNPRDIEGHRAHRKRLQEQIGRLRAHLERLRESHEP